MPEFGEFLDAWLQDQGILMHSTTLERIEDAGEEFYNGQQRPWPKFWADYAESLHA